MKYLIFYSLSVLFCCVFAQENLDKELRALRGQGKSRFDWKRMSPDDFLDYKSWKRKIENESSSDVIINKQYKEIMGKVISCVGDCRLSRGVGSSQAHFLSTIREGDEVETGEDSYIWIYLIDGSLVRIAPFSAMSFKEINVGESDFFVHVRMNSGLFYWRNKVDQITKSSHQFETDPLAFPLQIHQANIIKAAKNVSPLEIFEEQDYRSLHNDRANQWIRKNSLVSSRKKSFSYIVLPNATIKGRNLEGHIFVNNGLRSFFRFSKTKKRADLMLRGYKKSRLQKIVSDKWWEVDAFGKVMFEKKDHKRHLSIVHSLTKRIPSYIIAREMMFRKYTAPLLDRNLDREKLAKRYGYRLWGKISETGSDLQKRILFLDEYVRRTETTLLKESAALYKKSVFSRQRDFSSKYYSLALRSYLASVSGDKLNVNKKFYRFFVNDVFDNIEEQE